LIGGLLGIDAPLALAVALLKRGRDLLIGVPALLCWQLLEARNFRLSRREGVDGNAAGAAGAVSGARSMTIAPAESIASADSAVDR